MGLIPPNAWGLYDMHGNAMEWCSDWYGDYTVSSKTNPTGPESGLQKVLRGGFWGSQAFLCRSARRFKDYPHWEIQAVGFRLVIPN